MNLPREGLWWAFFSKKKVHRTFEVLTMLQIKDVNVDKNYVSGKPTLIAATTEC